MSAGSVKRRKLSDGQAVMCRECGHLLGHYHVLYHRVNSGPLQLAVGDIRRRYEEGSGQLWFDERGGFHADWVHRLPAEKGPRTGIGIYTEKVGRRTQIRVVCHRCPRNEPMDAEAAALSADPRNHDGEPVWFL